MKRLYLHIGLHKTGTTAIQQSLAKVRPYLLDLDLDVVPLGQRDTAGHHNLAAEVRGLPRFDPALGTWADALSYMDASPASSFFISAEDLSYLAGPRLKRFANDLSGLDVRVLLVLRNQPDYVESLYAEAAKVGRAGEISQFVHDSLRDLGAVLDSHSLLERWSAAFGRDSLRLMLYEDLRGDLVRNFMAAAGLPIPEALPGDIGTARNSSYSYDFFAARRALTGSGLTDDVLLETASLLGWHKGSGSFFSHSQRSAILEQCLESNRWLEKEGFALPEEYFSLKPRAREPMEPLSPEKLETFRAAALLVARQHELSERCSRIVQREGPEAALRLFDELDGLEPLTRLTVHSIASRLLELGRIEEARLWVRRSTTAWPGTAVGEFLKARIARAEGREADFAALLQEALRQDPSCLPPRILLADMLLSSGQHQAALDCARIGLGYDPEHAQFRQIERAAREALGEIAPVV